MTDKVEDKKLEKYERKNYWNCHCLETIYFPSWVAHSHFDIFNLTKIKFAILSRVFKRKTLKILKSRRVI